MHWNSFLAGLLFCVLANISGFGFAPSFAGLYQGETQPPGEKNYFMVYVGNDGQAFLTGYAPIAGHSDGDGIYSSFRISTDGKWTGLDDEGSPFTGGFEGNAFSGMIRGVVPYSGTRLSSAGSFYSLAGYYEGTITGPATATLYMILAADGVFNYSLRNSQGEVDDGGTGRLASDYSFVTVSANGTSVNGSINPSTATGNGSWQNGPYSGTVSLRRLRPLEDSSIPADIVFYGVHKGRVFVQTSSAAPVLGASQPFWGGAIVDPAASNSVMGATLQLPDGSSKNLVWYVPLGLFAWMDYFVDKAALDAVYPRGTYMLRVNTLHAGNQSLSLAMGDDQYPGPLRVANLDEASHIEVSKDFTLHWDAQTGAMPDDRIRLYVYDNRGLIIFGTPLEPLPGSATSLTIPANTLAAGGAYSVRLSYIKVSVPGDSAGVLSDISFYARTDFTVRTLEGPRPKFSLVKIMPDGSCRLEVAGLAGRNARLEATYDFLNWTSLGALSSASEPGVYLDASASGSKSRFYRVVLEP